MIIINDGAPSTINYTFSKEKPLKSNFVFSGITLILFLVIAPAIVLGGEVGIFLSDQPNCKVRTTTDIKSCRKDAIISAGDVIITKNSPSKLAVQWISSKFVKLEPVSTDQYRVVFHPPVEKSIMITMIADMLGFARKAGYISREAVTRSGFGMQPMLPGDYATILSDELVTFSWCANGIRKIEIALESGEVVKVIEVPEGRNSITLNSTVLNLKRAVLYAWKPAGASNEGGRILLLDDELAKIIVDGLQSINNSELTGLSKEYSKSIFIKVLTDNYPTNYSLGWLQYKIINEFTLQPEAKNINEAEFVIAESSIRFCK